MTQEKDSEGTFSGLRTRAEETLSRRLSDTEDVSVLSPVEVQRLVHELRVHQIELEMQNEDLRQAQVKLEELKDNYLDLYDFAPAGYVTLNEKGLILEANLTAVRLLGVERQSLMKMFLSRFVCQELGDTYYLYLQQVFETRSKQTCEIKLTRQDGTHFCAQLVSVAVQDESGQCSRCRTIVSDVTERKRTEKKIRDSEARLWDLYDNAPNAYFSVGTDGLIRKCNKSAEELLGYPREMLEGKGVFDLYVDGPEGKEKAAKVFQKFISGEQVANQELQMQKADRSPIWISLSVNTLRDADGKVMESRSAVVDITERKRNEELTLQAARLKSVADLSSGVAHHFNNLLQIVMASTSLSLMELELGEFSEIKTNLEKMLQAARLGAETVLRLQTFANIRADVTEGEGAIFDIAITAENAAEVSKPLWKSDPEKKGIKIDLQLNLQDGCLVKGKENEVFEVLLNLIRNAAEGMPQGGDIELKAHVQGKDVVVEVRDTGIGIAEDDLPRVFQPFWSTRGVGIGKGMGLAVSHGLIKRHGGSISVQSKVGAGTTFTIRLPLSQEPIRKPEEPAMRPAEGHLTILVIDDDLSIPSLLERILAKAGQRVFKAFSGDEGLAIFNKEPMDLVICDLGMPGMSGWDVGKVIRSICQERGIPKPAFVLLTGWGGQELEREKIAESGVDAVVAKPIDSARVISTVQEIAERTRGDRGRFS